MLIHGCVCKNWVCRLGERGCGYEIIKAYYTLAWNNLASHWNPVSLAKVLGQGVNETVMIESKGVYFRIQSGRNSFWHKVPLMVPISSDGFSPGLKVLSYRPFPLLNAHCEKPEGGCREPPPTPESRFPQRWGLSRTKDLYILPPESYLFLLRYTRKCASDWLTLASHPPRPLAYGVANLISSKQGPLTVIYSWTHLFLLIVNHWTSLGNKCLILRCELRHIK